MGSGLSVASLVSHEIINDSDVLCIILSSVVEKNSENTVKGHFELLMFAYQSAGSDNLVLFATGHCVDWFGAIS